MRLSFKEKYQSIEFFNPIDLPDFTILTGVNGSGKSHLLNAIKDGKLTIDDIQTNEITYFDYRTFFAQDEQTANNSTIGQERSQTWSYLSTDTNFNSIPLRQRFNAFKSGFIPEYDEILKISNEKPLFSLTLTDLGGKTILFNKLKAYVQQVEDLFNNNNNLRRQPLSETLFSLARRSPKIPTDLTKEEFENIYQAIGLKDNFLPTGLSKAFLDYKFKQFEELVIKKAEKEAYGRPQKYTSKEAFKKDYGTEPWKLIEVILKKFESLDFEINDPDNLEFTFPYGQAAFTVQLTHLKKKIPIPFSSLSSGEKVLLALALSLYNSQTVKLFPKLLLLDEIDASLHPSMIKNLLSVVKSVLVKENNIKVIMVTHSPSTIALAEENDVYVVNKEGINKIEKQTRQIALGILSTGFGAITLEESEFGMSYDLSKTDLPVLFTEGITDKIILETAWKKLFPEKHQPFYIQDFFDANSLCNLLSRSDQAPDGIFHTYTDKTFISLFDFDNAGYNQWNSLRKKFIDYTEKDPRKCLTIKHNAFKAYSILLPVPNNEIENQVIIKDNETYKGESVFQIEHLFYGISVLDNYFDKESKVGGGEIIIFKENKKREFADSLKNFDKDIFTNCIPLFNKIEEIIALGK